MLGSRVPNADKRWVQPYPCRGSGRQLSGKLDNKQDVEPVTCVLEAVIWLGKLPREVVSKELSKDPLCWLCCAEDLGIPYASNGPGVSEGRMRRESLPDSCKVNTSF